ncbi:MAG: aminoacetone oxidase family FAD-binding enzyme [Firmicutes bacterium]|nr:aminoacetone oxidase family FAD-binding enzyme [Bacillota bacterium]
MTRIAIIGGGACGLVAANQLKRKNPGLEVVVMERNPTVGKKILMTGNSKGNLSNLHVAPEAYNYPEFVRPSLRFGPEAFLDFAKLLGLQTKIDEEGRIWPYSESANSYLDVLRLSNKELGVKELTNYEVFALEQNAKKQFIIDGTEIYDYVVIATGSNAGYGPKAPATSLPKMIKATGHHYTELYPCVCPIGVQENIRSLSGLHIKCGASIFVDGNKKYTTEGEIQFKDDALSGIAIFELSSFLARAFVVGPVARADVELDLFPEQTEKAVEAMLLSKHALHPERLAPEFFVGLFSKMIGLYIINRLKLQMITEASITEMAHLFKHFRFAVNLGYHVTNNQVVSGGVALSEVNAQTLESKLFPRLYLGGEVLDIDGLCGGYNLHFAFASGSLIADSINERITHHD